jgi:hypothetical protein
VAKEPTRMEGWGLGCWLPSQGPSSALDCYVRAQPPFRLPYHCAGLILPKFVDAVEASLREDTGGKFSSDRLGTLQVQGFSAHGT